MPNTKDPRGANRKEYGDPAAYVYQPEDETGSSLVRAAEAELMPRAGVEGVGIGLTDTGEEALVVYVRSRADAAGLPASFRGAPVIVRETGIIRPYEADADVPPAGARRKS